MKKIFLKLFLIQIVLFLNASFFVNSFVLALPAGLSTCSHIQTIPSLIKADSPEITFNINIGDTSLSKKWFIIFEVGTGATKEATILDRQRILVTIRKAPIADNAFFPGPHTFYIQSQEGQNVCGGSYSVGKCTLDVPAKIKFGEPFTIGGNSPFKGISFLYVNGNRLENLGEGRFDGINVPLKATQVGENVALISNNPVPYIGDTDCITKFFIGSTTGTGDVGIDVNAICPNGQRGVFTALGCIPTENTGSFMAWLLRLAIGIGGGVAFILMLVGVFQIIISGGDPEKLKAGKELITSAIMGLIMIIFSLFLLRLIGVQILQIPGFGK